MGNCHRGMLIIEGGCKIEGDSDKWDFGEGAGYYVDATEEKWAKNYRMFTYVNDEFYQLMVKNFNVDPKRIGIFGSVDCFDDQNTSENHRLVHCLVDTVWVAMAR